MGGIFASDQLDGLVVGVSVEQPLAGQHLVQEDTDGEDIRSLIDVLATRGLGRQIAHLALDHAWVGRFHLAGGLGEAKVGQLDLAILRDKHVGRRNVAVDDS